MAIHIGMEKTVSWYRGNRYEFYIPICNEERESGFRNSVGVSVRDVSGWDRECVISVMAEAL